MLLSQKADSFSAWVASKIITRETLSSVVDTIRHENKTIATLNGSFDLLHAGHLEMIYQASRQADVLIVALNSDASIKKYKSPLRPIIPLQYRMQMVAALSMVDYVTSFEETDPRQILALLKPDVHVNGSEYGEDCIEAELIKKQGGRMYIVPLLQGLSTSNIIKKIVETCAV